MFGKNKCCPPSLPLLRPCCIAQAWQWSDWILKLKRLGEIWNSFPSKSWRWKSEVFLCPKRGRVSSTSNLARRALYPGGLASGLGWGGRSHSLWTDQRCSSDGVSSWDEREETVLCARLPGRVLARRAAPWGPPCGREGAEPVRSWNPHPQGSKDATSSKLPDESEARRKSGL